MKKSIIISLLTMLGVYASFFVLPVMLFSWIYNKPGYDSPENLVILNVWSGTILLAGIGTFCTNLIIREIRKDKENN